MATRLFSSGEASLDRQVAATQHADMRADFAKHVEASVSLGDKAAVKRADGRDVIVEITA